MQNKLKFKTILCLFALLLVQNANAADESSTTKATVAAKSDSTNTTAQTTTTPKPKVDVLKSALCKKCNCDTDDSLLDCSDGRLKDWFTADDWETLQNGDKVFQTFKLQKNGLKEIQALPAHPVVKLYLSFNEIVEIEDAAFQNLTELAVLDLSHNKLDSKALKPDIFKGIYSKNDYEPLGKMKELDLGYNDLHTLDDDLFEHLPYLETLILCKNIFQVVDHLALVAITGLTSLKTLDMSFMELKELPESFLHGPRELETLILTGNLLDEVPETLEQAVNLKELNLDENLIGAISAKNTFPKMENLRHLSLSYMPHLTKIGDGGFSKLQNLTTLIMTNNPKLSTIEPKAFKRNTTNPLIFDYPPLEELHLNNNNLSKLEKHLFERWDKIKTIDLRLNPWACDESNYYLINILLVQINATTPNLAKELKCGSPDELKTLTFTDSRVRENTKNANDNNIAGVAIACAVVAVLLGIPLIIGTIIIYRRGCFGLLYGRSVPAGAHYTRAGSAEDLHI